jgi:hypothetical protein
LKVCWTITVTAAFYAALNAGYYAALSTYYFYQRSAQDNESAGYLYTWNICKHENYRRHFEISNYYSG